MYPHCRRGMWQTAQQDPSRSRYPWVPRSVGRAVGSAGDRAVQGGDDQTRPSLPPGSTRRCLPSPFARPAPVRPSPSPGVRNPAPAGAGQPVSRSASTFRSAIATNAGRAFSSSASTRAIVGWSRPSSLIRRREARRALGAARLPHHGSLAPHFSAPFRRHDVNFTGCLNLLLDDAIPRMRAGVTLADYPFF